jgi:phage tail-like protein
MFFNLASAMQWISSDPIPNFYFMVGVGTMPLAVVTGLFMPGYTEVQGLTIEIGTEATNEVGTATAVHFPKGIKNESLILKRYVRASFIDPMGDWCQETFASAKTWSKGIKLKELYITVNHPSTKAPICVFQISKAYPIKLEVDSLNSTANDALQETIELKYRDIKRIL